MSDVSSNVSTTTHVMQTVIDTLNSGWGYSIGGVLLVVAAGYFGLKKLNTPTFVVKQIRRRNQKEMRKQGVENTEAMVDLDRLLDAVEAYAIKQSMTGSAMTKLLAPLNNVSKTKSGGDFYHSMSYIAKSIDNPTLASALTKKSKQVKSSSALMAGLLKRAGV
jgi:poly(3-hydroxyalkanoate) synthetase